jgi:hypothetical protein
LSSIDCPLLKIAYTHMAVESKGRIWAGDFPMPYFFTEKA